jgi:hypothetical protein
MMMIIREGFETIAEGYWELTQHNVHWLFISHTLLCINSVGSGHLPTSNTPVHQASYEIEEKDMTSIRISMRDKTGVLESVLKVLETLIEVLDPVSL